MARLKTTWNISVIIEENIVVYVLSEVQYFLMKRWNLDNLDLRKTGVNNHVVVWPTHWQKRKSNSSQSNETVILLHKNVDLEHDNAIYQRIMETECEFRRLAASTIVWLQCDIPSLVNGSIQLRISDDFFKHSLKPIKNESFMRE